MGAQRVEILLYADCLGSEAFAVHDALALANQLGPRSRFDVRLVSIGGRLVRSGGIALTPDRASSKPHLLIVPGMMAAGSADIIARTERLADERIHIGRARRGGARIGAICVGAFLVAAANVCDGRRVTTAWPMADALQRWRGDLRVEREHMVLKDGPFITTGAMSAAYDLALVLVEEANGVDAALRLRKLLALDGDRTDQRRYEGARAGARQSDPLVERAQFALQRTLAQGFDLEALAHECGASARTLLRRFKAVTGETPLEYRHRLVTEAVKTLLETTTLPLSHIPARVGYADEVSLRRLFRAHTAMTFKEYRRRFGVLPAHRG